MIHHWKALDLEITDFQYRHDSAYTGESKAWNIIMNWL